MWREKLGREVGHLIAGAPQKPVKPALLVLQARRQQLKCPDWLLRGRSGVCTQGVFLPFLLILSTDFLLSLLFSSLLCLLSLHVPGILP